MKNVDWQAAFVENLGMTRARAWHYFRRHYCVHTRQDKVSEVVALCWARWQRLIAQGRDPRILAARIVDYVLRAVLGGQTVSTTLRTSDVLNPSCQEKRGHCVYRLEEISDRNRAISPEDLTDTKGADPAQLAATHVDWRDWLQGLTHFERCLCDYFAQGLNARETAQRYGLHRTTVETARKRLRDSWDRYGVNVD